MINFPLENIGIIIEIEISIESKNHESIQIDSKSALIQKVKFLTANF